MFAPIREQFSLPLVLGGRPDLAESVSSLLLGPFVGKLVGGPAEAIAAALGGGAH
jgi:hypothetical protein